MFALNAFGGWHDTAPFIAWPATNHLRWVDNVGVYTNASNPTNPAYGAWTNNFVFADWYAGNTLSFGGDILFPYVLQSTNYSWVTNVVLNAKEVRAMDCFAALLERHRATGGDITNFWEVATPYTVVDGNFTYYLLWRDERLAIRAMKDLLRTYEVDGYYGWGLLAKFYYPSPANSPTNFLAYTETTLAVASGVPTNFFDYTPHRAADGSWTHYQRTLTNTFVLRQGTNAAHVATNSLVDSAGIEFTAIGTNGTTVTRYATNVNQQAGVDLGVYGWDGLRMVISNLNTTVKANGWAVGSLTNYQALISNNFSYAALTGFSVHGQIGQSAGTIKADIISAAEEANSNLTYLVNNPSNDTWQWSLSDGLTSPTITSVTNQAPSFSLYASFSHRYDLEVDFESPVGIDGLLTTTNWGVSGDIRVHYQYATNKMSVKNSALYGVSATGIADRVIILTYATNGVMAIGYSNTVDISIGAVTSDVLSASVPTNIVFGFENIGARDWTVITGGSPDGWMLSGGAGFNTMDNFRDNYYRFLWQTDTNFASISASTNIVGAVYTNGLTVEVWDFEYK